MPRTSCRVLAGSSCLKGGVEMFVVAHIDRKALEPLWSKAKTCAERVFSNIALCQYQYRHFRRPSSSALAGACVLQLTMTYARLPRFLQFLCETAVVDTVLFGICKDTQAYRYIIISIFGISIVAKVGKRSARRTCVLEVRYVIHAPAPLNPTGSGTLDAEPQSSRSPAT